VTYKRSGTCHMRIRSQPAGAEVAIRCVQLGKYRE
jgi:hypothetical protein